MPKARNRAIRWMNILLAVAALCMMIVLPTVVSFAVSLGALFVAGLVNGGLNDVVAADVYALMNEHINLYSAAVYVIFGIPVFAWAWGMRHRARARSRGAGARDRLFANPQIAAGAPSGNAPGGTAASSPVASGAPTPPADDALTATAVPIAIAPTFGTAAAAPAPASPNAPRHIYYGAEPVSWQLAAQASQERDAMQPQPNPAVSSAKEEAASSAVRFSVKGVARRYFAAGALMGYGMQVVTTLLMVLVEMFLPAVMEEYTSLVESSGITTYGLMWMISTLVLPPLVEETGFRGLGLTYLERAGVPFAVANVIQALAFGIFHMNLTQGIYTFVLGLLLGYVAHRSGSLAPAMLLHFTYNLMGTLGTSLIYDYLPAPFLFLLVTNAAALLCAFKLASAAPRTSSH